MMKARPNLLLYVALALGWLFDFLFWKKAPGINFALFAALCLLGGLYVLLSDAQRPNQKSLILFAPIAFFAAISFVRAEPMTAFLAYAFTLFALTVLSVTYRGGRWIQYAITDYVVKFLNLLGSMLARPLSFSAEVRKAQNEAGIKSSARAVWPILRGIIIALPIVAIFASLLSSADVVFGQRLDDFIKLFKLEDLPEYIFRLVYILVGAYALAGVFLHAATQSGDEKLAADGKPAIAPFLGAIEAGIVLGSVALLFAAFVIIQFQYFFGGQANIHIEGYTYSEYARRGFGELVTVAFFALLMLLSLSAVTKRETELQRRTFSGLGVALVVLVLIMLVSAYQRLALYEAAYGFSRLRTYTHVFLVWIGLLLIATIVLEILRRERLFAIAALIAALGFAATLPVLNVDAFIVTRNIRREVQGAPDAQGGVRRAALDAQYFLDLSDDAVPSLVEAYRASALPAEVQDRLGAALFCIRYLRENDRKGRGGYPWQSFHLARFYADRALTEVKAELAAYKVKDEKLPMVVITPEAEEFNCWQYYYD